jgi:hypothetical protein
MIYNKFSAFICKRFNKVDSSFLCYFENNSIRFLIISTTDSAIHIPASALKSFRNTHSDFRIYNSHVKQPVPFLLLVILYGFYRVVNHIA